MYHMWSAGLAGLALLLAAVLYHRSAQPQSQMQIEWVGGANSRVRTGESVLPGLGGERSQELAWRAEYSELQKLEKQAEAGLKKDPKAGEMDGGQGQGRHLNTNSTRGQMFMVKDDDGDLIPEETLKAEAAALGFQTVREWQQAMAHQRVLEEQSDHDHLSRAQKARVGDARVGNSRKEDAWQLLRSWVSHVLSAARREHNEQLYLVPSQVARAERNAEPLERFPRAVSGIRK